jgi:hypothetical protein
VCSTRSAGGWGRDAHLLEIPLDLLRVDPRIVVHDLGREVHLRARAQSGTSACTSRKPVAESARIDPTFRTSTEDAIFRKNAGNRRLRSPRDALPRLRHR